MRSIQFHALYAIQCFSCVLLFWLFSQEWEMMILAQLKWDTFTITPSDFMEPLLHRLPDSVSNTTNIRDKIRTFSAFCATGEFTFFIKLWVRLNPNLSFWITIECLKTDCLKKQKSCQSTFSYFFWSLPSRQPEGFCHFYFVSKWSHWKDTLFFLSVSIDATTATRFWRKLTISLEKRVMQYYVIL